MKTIKFILILSVLSSCKRLDWNNVNARKNWRGDLIGIANKNSFQQKPFSEWYSKFYKEYKIDTEIANKLKSKTKDITIKIFMGTWCDDSQIEVPHFYKILNGINFDYNNLKVANINRRKKARGLEKGYTFTKIPTFIIYRNKKEIGRIIEHPIKKSSLEKDLLNIIENN